MKKKRFSQFFRNLSHSRKTHKHFSGEFMAEELESRVLYSGSPAPVPADMVSDIASHVAPALIEASPGSEAANPSGSGSSGDLHHSFRSFDLFGYAEPARDVDVSSPGHVHLSLGDEFQTWTWEAAQPLRVTDDGEWDAAAMNALVESTSDVENVLLELVELPGDRAGYDISVSDNQLDKEWRVDPGLFRQVAEDRQTLAVPFEAETKVFEMEGGDGTGGVPAKVFGLPEIEESLGTEKSFRSFDLPE